MGFNQLVVELACHMSHRLQRYCDGFLIVVDWLLDSLSWDLVEGLSLLRQLWYGSSIFLFIFVHLLSTHSVPPPQNLTSSVSLYHPFWPGFHFLINLTFPICRQVWWKRFRCRQIISGLPQMYATLWNRSQFCDISGLVIML